MALPNHVVLVGLMGSGKSTIGRRIAKLLTVPFVDADDAFIPRYGQTVAQVVAESGEEVFRDRETELLGEIMAVETPVSFASGGGVGVREANRQLLTTGDLTAVYLHAEPSFLASRTKVKADRYLLAGEDPQVVLTRLYEQRDALYRQVARHVVEVTDFSRWGSEPKRTIAAHIANVVQLLGDPE